MENRRKDVTMETLWREARRHLAGGVSSPVRAFKAVGGTPVFIEQGLGPYLFDAEKRRYIDLCLSWGAVLLGHADAEVVRAVSAQAAKGTSFGAATENETRLAREIKRAFPRMEKIRFTSSGTEAAMSAIRLARGVTKRSRIVKFEGCYHGHSDGLLVQAGSGLATFGSPSSLGVPREIAALTTVLPYNDAGAVEHFFKVSGRETAGVIVEPVAGNMGVVPADPGFLEALRRATRRSGSLLIFDEVISGFRVGFGGAQHLYGIEPDITVLGKIIGGGLPIGAFGARAAVMDALSPDGKVYQAGTLSGNPLSMAAGLSVLSRLDSAFYRELNRRAAAFTKCALGALRARKKTVSMHGAGSMFTIYFSAKAPRNFKEACRTSEKEFKIFFQNLLKMGVYAPPSRFEASFLSAAHTEDVLEGVLGALKKI
jgi:glutamate-1-semialdehyde 2,1-aminomutase